MTTVDTFGGQQITLPAEVPGWDTDDNNQRYDFTYTRRTYPTERIVSNITDFGLFDILSNSCSNPHDGHDGKDGKPEINEYTVTLHCKELLYIAEVIRVGGGAYCYKVLGVYERSV